MNAKELNKKVGIFCKQFRENHLDITLTEFCKVTDQNIKNVSAFESGRANNIKYLYYYYQMASEEKRKLFAKYIFELI